MYLYTSILQAILASTVNVSTIKSQLKPVKTLFSYEIGITVFSATPCNNYRRSSQRRQHNVNITTFKECNISGYTAAMQLYLLEEVKMDFSFVLYPFMTYCFVSV